MVHGRGCNPHRSLWRHWWHHNSETITDREKRRPLRPMKSSKLSNGENRIALRQLLQNRKWHLWRHNLGSRWKLQKMAWENFSIGVFYNITKNQDNPLKTVGRDSFLIPKTIKNTTKKVHSEMQLNNNWSFCFKIWVTGLRYNSLSDRCKTCKNE